MAASAAETATTHQALSLLVHAPFEAVGTRGALVKSWANAALVGIAIIIASSAEAVATSKRPFVQGVYVGKGSQRAVGPSRRN